MNPRQIIRTSGAVEPLDRSPSIAETCRLIGADALDTVNLRDGSVMLLDDLGHPKRRPLNAIATKLYHAVCRPGTTHQILGDVVIVHDADFADSADVPGGLL